jgi:hypothetical protein
MFLLLVRSQPSVLRSKNTLSISCLFALLPSDKQEGAKGLAKKVLLLSVLAYLDKQA